MRHVELTERVIGSLITVRRALGPGLAESSYQAASALELHACGIDFVREPRLEVRYRDIVIGHHRPDFIVEGKVVLELKCVTSLDPVFVSQVLTYLRVSKLQVGLLVNFNVAVLRSGVRRIALCPDSAASRAWNEPSGRRPL
jgi:GxxExxY protein